MHPSGEKEQSFRRRGRARRENSHRDLRIDSQRKQNYQTRLSSLRLILAVQLTLSWGFAAVPLQLWPEKIASKKQWEEKIRPEILRRMQEVMGPLPGNDKRCELEPRIEEEVDCGTYIRRF